MGKSITLKASDGHEFSAYRADPAGKPKGCMIVIQEIFGVNDHIKSVADRVAANGYLAVAPALQDRGERNFEVGYTPADIEKGKEVRGKVKNEDSIKDLRATLAYLQQEGGGAKVGVVGYCWGGSLAWLAATEIDGLAVAICYYGGEIANNADRKAKCPVMFHFGEKDMSIPMSMVETIKQKQPEHPLYVYAAGHGFSCDARGSFDKAAHELALQRTREYAAKYVG